MCVCMYECMYECICELCMYACIYVYMCECMYVSMHLCVCECIYVCMYVRETRKKYTTRYQSGKGKTKLIEGILQLNTKH